MRPQNRMTVLEKAGNKEFVKFFRFLKFFDILEDKVVQGKKCTCQFGLGLSSYLNVRAKLYVRPKNLFYKEEFDPGSG